MRDARCERWYSNDDEPCHAFDLPAQAGRRTKEESAVKHKSFCAGAARLCPAPPRIRRAVQAMVKSVAALVPAGRCRGGVGGDRRRWRAYATVWRYSGSSGVARAQVCAAFTSQPRALMHRSLARKVHGVTILRRATPDAAGGWCVPFPVRLDARQPPTVCPQSARVPQVNAGSPRREGTYARCRPSREKSAWVCR